MKKGARALGSRASGAFDAKMRRTVHEHSCARQSGGGKHGSQFRFGIRGAYRIGIKLVHQTLIAPSMPANVQGVGKARWPEQIAKQNRAVRLGEPCYFREQVLGPREVVQNGIAHHEIEAGIGEGESVAVGDLKFGSLLHGRVRRARLGEIGACLSDHGRGTVDASE